MKITPESFTFPTQEIAFKPKKITQRKKKRSKPAVVTQTVEPEASFPVLSSHEIASLLHDRKIYIEKKLYNYTHLKDIAESMGAIVRGTFDRSVTDYITDIKSGDKQMKAAANKGKRFVSPLWLTSCYSEKRYLPPIHFPYNLQKDVNCLAAVEVRNELDDNPFGLEEVDYDSLEATRPGQQLNLDNFITRLPRLNGEQEDSFNISQAETEDMRSAPTQQVETTQEKHEEYDNEMEEMQKEFFYNNNVDSNNSSSNSSSRKRAIENSQELLARKLRKSEIASRLNSAKSPSDPSSSASSSNKKPTRTSTRNHSQKETMARKSDYGQPKFNIWYGEQRFVTSNNK